MLFKAWFFIFRPWSYTATFVPFLLAAGLVSHEASASWWRWGVGIFVGLLFQMTVNLLNSWGDERSGVDRVPNAICTTPQVQEGVISMRSLLIVALSCAALGALAGLSLCFRMHEGRLVFDTPLLIIGLVGALGATNYSTGLKFKYRGLGVPFVSLLMGPLETLAAHELLMPGRVPALLATIPVAALVGVVMHGNDMRDMPTDRIAGIKTLAILLKPTGALAYYWICHLTPYLYSFTGAWWVWFAFPLTARTLYRATTVWRLCPTCPPWRRLERDSGLILLAVGLLLYVGMVAQ